jgi:hypothetical protein
LRSWRTTDPRTPSQVRGVEPVKPLQQKEEPVYVVAGGDAEEYVEKRFPNKTPRRVGLTLRPRTIDHFVLGLPLLFQRRPAAGLDAVYHFTFTGADERDLTVTIRHQRLEVVEELTGRADVSVVADADAWVRFVGREPSNAVTSVLALVPDLLRRRIRIRGDPRLLLRFEACFPV